MQHAPADIEVRLVLRDGAERAGIEQAVLVNLRQRMRSAGVPESAEPAIRFTDTPPEKNPRSGKLVRVVRAFAEG